MAEWKKERMAKHADGLYFMCDRLKSGGVECISKITVPE
jgi:hypothetical protein